MANDGKILLEEHNIISLRTTFIIDAGGHVALQMLPASSSMAPKLNVYKTEYWEWLKPYSTFLYQHIPSGGVIPFRGIKELAFEKPPELKLLWADSGNSVAVYLNGEPWAFIDEHTQKAYSKGVLTSSLGKPWNQEIFEKTFAGVIDGF
jgi:hypothetical protein